ncbi:fibroblast growth factor receptor 4-like, partial [Stegodyphus dumicola]|uniref:fibroblast growth factor receptor 4-like n=1 Tax=Stegodyphus dumicola TaxID=202533 RepID=UPI0015AB3332
MISCFKSGAQCKSQRNKMYPIYIPTVLFLFIISIIQASSLNVTHQAPFFTKSHKMNDLTTAFSGSSANFRCAADGTPAPDVIWFKDGMPIEKDHRVRMQKWSLKLDDINSDDEGIYTCIVSNTEGSIRFNFTLVVTDRIAYQPIIIEDFATNQTAYVGETVVLECKFSSDLHHTVQWVKYFEMNGSSADEFGVPYGKIVEVWCWKN